MLAMLSFTTGVWRGRDIAIPEAGAKIGREAGLDIVIPTEDQRYVSRLHAVIRVEDGRYVIEDRRSTNGTLVNGRAITRAVLEDGDEIQFGRQGPLARFRAPSPAAAGATVRADDAVVGRGAGAQPPSPPSSPPQASPEGQPPSRHATRPRKRYAVWLGAAAVVIIATAMAATTRLGAREEPEQALRRLAEEYESRVVLVEVGLRVGEVYIGLGSGTGFFAGSGGYIITNKHVIHSHLYSLSSACAAEAIRRRGLSYEDSLVITVWQGGTRFRHNPRARGDRGLGYSTEHNTLRLAALAPNNLGPERRVGCTDPFGGRSFDMTWRRHDTDNNDLAVLRSTASHPHIPLAQDEPQPDEPVMVLGFPVGTAPLETNVAEPIRRTGRVLRVQETIHIDAVVLGGNSGGPLIDSQGRVVGITTMGYAESLNMAIKAEYARRLLDRARAAPLE